MQESEEKEPRAFIGVPIDSETLRRLLDLSRSVGDDPREVAASLLRDVLKDDEDSNYLLTVEPISDSVN